MHETINNYLPSVGILLMWKQVIYE